MKRGRNEIELPNKGPVGGGPFAVVRGTHTGLYERFDQVVIDRQTVYRKFPSKEEAEKWFLAAKDLPSLHDPNACEIHIASYCFDVTQDKDWYAAVGIYFGRGDHRNLFSQASCGVNLDYAIFMEALKRASPLQNIRIYTNSKGLAYGFNYGLYNWPKHALSGERDPVWSEIYQIIEQRKLKIALDWNDTSNVAYQSVLAMCRHQCSGRIPSHYTRVRMECCYAWLQCARRMGLLKVLRIIIAKLLWKANERHGIPVDYFL